VLPKSIQNLFTILLFSYENLHNPGASFTEIVKKMWMTESHNYMSRPI